MQTVIKIVEVDPKNTPHAKLLQTLYNALDTEQTAMFVKATDINDSVPYDMPLDERVNGELLTLLYMDTPVAICDYRIVPEGKNFTMVVSSLYVDTAYRNKGYASRIMKHLVDIARKRHCDVWTLNVMAGNEIAIKLYERFGLKLYSHSMMGKI